MQPPDCMKACWSTSLPIFAHTSTAELACNRAVSSESMKLPSAQIESIQHLVVNADYRQCTDCCTGQALPADVPLSCQLTPMQHHLIAVKAQQVEMLTNPPLQCSSANADMHVRTYAGMLTDLGLQAPSSPWQAPLSPRRQSIECHEATSSLQ